MHKVNMKECYQMTFRNYTELPSHDQKKNVKFAGERQPYVRAKEDAPVTAGVTLGTCEDYFPFQKRGNITKITNQVSNLPTYAFTPYYPN